MAIIIKHTHSANVEIHFMGKDGFIFRQRMIDTMDNLTEHVCDMFNEHNFTYADVYDASTGEVLMQLERA